MNELLESDPEATNEFFLHHKTVVNKLVCNHPTIQVFVDKNTKVMPNYGFLRVLGLINGLVQEKNKVVVMTMDESETEIVKFSIGTISENGIVREDK